MFTGHKPSFLIGLVGNGIGASRSPQLHEQEAACLGISLVYRLLDLEKLGLRDTDLGSIVRSALQMGFDGFNVTHPFKGAIIPLLQTLSPEAAAIGAVNTVTLKGGGCHGHNTDWYGFSQAIRRQLPEADISQVAQIGAGGAGSATAYAMLRLGTKRLVLCDSAPGRADALATKLTSQFPNCTISVAPDAASALVGVSGLIQATPIGMIGHPGLPLNPRFLSRDVWVADIIYTPAETELMQRARYLGCKAFNGELMVIFQAAKAFNIFTGVGPDPDRMARSFAGE